MIASPRRRLIWALGMLGLAAAVFYVAFRNLNASEPQAAGRPALPGFAMRAADITEYRISRSGETYRLVREGSRWSILERGGFPASTLQVQNLAAALANLKLERKLTADRRKFAALHLSDPRQGGTGALIQAIDGQGLERAALIAARRGSDLVVRLPGENVAYIAQGALPALDAPAAFADFRGLALPADRIRSVELIYAGRGAVILVRSKPGAAFAPTTRQAALPFDAMALAATRFQPFDVRADDSGNASLGERRITTFDGLVVTIRYDKRPDAIWATLSAGGSGSSEEALAINARADGWRFALPLNDEPVLFPASLDASAAPSRAPSIAAGDAVGELETAAAE